MTGTQINILIISVLFLFVAGLFLLSDETKTFKGEFNENGGQIEIEKE